MKESKKILEKITSKIEESGRKKKKEIRSLNLLANFDNGYANGWYMCVPSFFKDALDIKKTVRKNKNTNQDEKIWTQGKCFNFCEGDVLYNDRYAYCEHFERKAPVNHPRMCIQIESALPCSQAEGENQRFPGQVYLKVYFLENQPDMEHRRFVGYKTMTQDALVVFLISGPTANWFDDLEKAGPK